MTDAHRDGGNDDRRAMQPADPWLETSPTSPIEHAGAHPAPLSDTFIEPGTDPQQRSRGRGWLVVGAMVAAVLLCVGGSLLYPFGNDDDDPDQAGPTPQASVSATVAVTVKAAPRQTKPVIAKEEETPADEVVYLVTSTSKGDVASVSYTDEDRDIIRKGEVPLPWRHTFRITGSKPPLVINAQRKKGGTGEVTCSITLGGKELTNAVQRGRYAAPMCSG